MSILVTGATGLLGQAILREARRRGLDTTGAARHDAELILDLTDDTSVERCLKIVGPKLVINTAAMTSIEACNNYPHEAWRINARAVGVLAQHCRDHDAGLIQVSTDHFFSGDGSAHHDEEAPVTIVNEYAFSKFAGEAMATIAPRSLILRTNILGFRGWRNRPTFVEWATTALASGKSMTLFTDSFISALEVGQCATAVLDLAAARTQGLINLGSREVYSKKALIEAIAERLGWSLDAARDGSVTGLTPRRADSLGLDVSRAEQILDRQLPSLEEVVVSLTAEFENWTCVTTA